MLLGWGWFAFRSLPQQEDPKIPDRRAVVVTVFPDDNKKYLSTDLMREEPVKADFLSPHVELTGFQACKRVCMTCCDEDACAYVAGSTGSRPCGR